MHDQVADDTSPEAAQAAQASGTKTLPSNYPARRHRTQASRAPIPQLTHVATVLRQASADEPRLQEAAVELAEWVDSSELPEESLEHQLAWQILEHCAGTPGPLDLHTLAAFADIANQAQVVGPAQPWPISRIGDPRSSIGISTRGRTVSWRRRRTLAKLRRLKPKLR